MQVGYWTFQSLQVSTGLTKVYRCRLDLPKSTGVNWTYQSLQVSTGLTKVYRCQLDLPKSTGVDWTYQSLQVSTGLTKVSRCQLDLPKSTGVDSPPPESPSPRSDEGPGSGSQRSPRTSAQTAHGSGWCQYQGHRGQTPRAGPGSRSWDPLWWPLPTHDLFTVNITMD